MGLAARRLRRLRPLHGAAAGDLFSFGHFTGGAPRRPRAFRPLHGRCSSTTSSPSATSRGRALRRPLLFRPLLGGAGLGTALLPAGAAAARGSDRFYAGQSCLAAPLSSFWGVALGVCRRWSGLPPLCTRVIMLPTPQTRFFVTPVRINCEGVCVCHGVCTFGGVRRKLGVRL